MPVHPGAFRKSREPILLAKSDMRSSGCCKAVGEAEFVDMGGSTADGGCDVEVGAEPADVDGHAAEDVLQVSLGQAPVATVAQVRASDRFGDGALDPGTGVVCLAPGIAVLGGVGRHPGFMDGLGM